MKNKLYMTTGLPRSGKSTWANSRNPSLPIVNPDAIRLALHGMPFVPSAEPIVWAVAKLMVRALFLAGHPRVILDATNITRERRDEWKSKDWVRHFKEFKTDTNTCMKRALDTNPDLAPVILAMEEKYEPVTADELEDGETCKEILEEMI